QHRIALARDARAGEREGGETLCGLVRERVGADEAGLPLAAPAEARRDRIAILREVVSVEVEADLEPAGVAGAEPGGRRAVARQHVPDGRRPVRRAQELDAVLA